MRLHFPSGLTSDIEITKDGCKYLYFTAKSNHCKYRLDKTSEVIQMAPYWTEEPKLKLQEERKGYQRRF